MYDLLQGLTVENQAVIIVILSLVAEKLFQLVRWLINVLFKKGEADLPNNKLNWELTMAKVATIESVLDDMSECIKKSHDEDMDMRRKAMRMQEELYSAHLGPNAKDVEGRLKWWYPQDMTAAIHQQTIIMSEVLGELRAIRRQEGYALSSSDNLN